MQSNVSIANTTLVSYDNDLNRYRQSKNMSSHSINHNNQSQYHTVPHYNTIFTE